jgi:DUF971 family protein
MTDATVAEPVQITPFPNGELGIVWSDGHESYYNQHALRCACTCAGCVDEMTGRKVLQDDLVPADVHLVKWDWVGRYGINILWSDQHDTGIYTLKHLRRLCGCGECGG